MHPLDSQIGKQFRDDRLNPITLYTPPILSLPILGISGTVFSVRLKDVSTKLTLQPIYYRLVCIRNGNERTKGNPSFLTMFGNRKCSFSINKTSKVDVINVFHTNISVSIIRQQLIFKDFLDHSQATFEAYRYSLRMHRLQYGCHRNSSHERDMASYSSMSSTCLHH